MADAHIVDALRSVGQLVYFHATSWTASAKDDLAAMGVQQAAGATGKAARVYKNLLVNNDQELRDLRSEIGAARSFFYKNTREWGRMPGAPRLLPSSEALTFLTEMTKCKQRVAALREKFIEVYPERVEAAKKDLGKLADDIVYPPAQQIAARFTLSYEFQPIPSTTGFDGLATELATKLETHCTQQLEKRLKMSIETSMAEVREAAQNVVERMSAEKTRIHDTLLENVARPARLMRPFNITDDEQLAAITSQAVDNVGAYRLEAIRDDVGNARADLLADAQKLVELIDNYQAS